MKCKRRKRCPNQIAPHSVSGCLECLNQTRLRQNKKRAERRSQGLCDDCLKPSIPGERLCLHHRALSRHRAGTTGGRNQPRPKRGLYKIPKGKQARWRYNNRMKGLCDRCGKPAAPYHTCEVCREKKKSSWQLRRTAREVMTVAIVVSQKSATAEKK